MRDFNSDPFVKEAIELFRAVDQCLPCFLLPDLNHNKIKSHFSLFKELERLKNDQRMSSEFCQAVECELLRLKIRGLQNKIDFTKQDIPKKTVLSEYDGNTLKKICKVAGYTLHLMPYGVMDFITPEGRKKDLILNVMICVLIEYGKIKYPRENHFSVLAKKFSSTLFNMTGWEKSKRTPRMKIFDRYKAMQKNFDVHKIYADIHNIVTLSE